LSLDWINLALGYLPFLHRFYAPADARAAFIAVRDAAAHYGGHIVAIPRDTLPVLTRQGTSEPLWQADDAWSAVTPMRSHPNAKTAILALGAPTYLAAAASEKATAAGVATDVYVVNGFPLADDFLADIASRYECVLTVEDGLIGTPAAGLQGFAGLAASSLASAGVSLHHFGIVDPSVAPSESFVEVWEHFGISEKHLLDVLLEKP
jgi:deoxyxylulose-5-phosphate synthase